MKVTVTAKDSFAHGPNTYVNGDPVEVSIYEARDLAKRGLTSDPEDGGEAQPEPAETKMAAATDNKMVKTVSNKSSGSK